MNAAGHRPLRHLTASALALMILLPTVASAQKRIMCPDGTGRIEIDVKQIAIQYEASSMAATLSSLSMLSTRLAIEPKPLQEAAAATQQLNEFMKGLAVRY